MLFFECMLLSEQFSTRVNKEYVTNNFKNFVIKMEVFKVIIMINRSVKFYFELNVSMVFFSIQHSYVFFYFVQFM